MTGDEDAVDLETGVDLEHGGLLETANVSLGFVDTFFPTRDPLFEDVEDVELDLLDTEPWSDD